MGKLVRDKIPEIIEAQGRECKTRELEVDEYEKELYRKLDEEVLEFKQATMLSDLHGEAGDILEVLVAILKLRGSSINALERVRKAKYDERGGFSKRIYLEDTN